MADAKKSTAIKPKAAPAKKPAAKKTTVHKKTTATKTPAKRTAAKPAVKATTPTSQFMTIQPTRETAYWLIFSLLILALGIWVLTLTVRINDIYDQIERSNNAAASLDAEATSLRATKATAPAAE